VERATTFLRSDSKQAHKPAYIIVSSEILDMNCAGYTWKRKRRYTPAVTSVDECTRAETGVGADIAEGSQQEKGNKADLVIEAKTNKTQRNKLETEQ